MTKERKENRKERNFFNPCHPLFLLIYSYVHTLFGLFLLPVLAPSLSTHLPLLQGRMFSDLFSNFVDGKT
jgi:hypothetical protein